jgi:hypothetical protein
MRRLDDRLFALSVLQAHRSFPGAVLLVTCKIFDLLICIVFAFASVNRYCSSLDKMKLTCLLPVAALFTAVSSEPIPGMSIMAII